MTGVKAASRALDNAPQLLCIHALAESQQQILLEHNATCSTSTQ